MRTTISTVGIIWRFITFSMSLPLIFLVVSNAMANGYEECNEILSQDIFNKISTNDSRTSASKSEAAAALFSQTDTAAWEAYAHDYEEAKKSGTKIDVEGHYAYIGGQLGIDLTSENRVSESEFRQKFNSAKATYSSTTSAKNSNESSVVSTYASYIRDTGTVNAWKDCVTKTKETNLYAFASRDKSGQSYVNVLWVPGALAGSIPSITISFVTGEANKNGVKVHSKPEELLAMGSGRNFLVTCQGQCDEGFLVTVNGTLKNSAGRATGSFTADVEVPPTTPKVVDFCQDLKGRAIYVLTNGYHGVVGPEGLALNKTDNGSRFTTNMVFSKETNRQFSAEIQDPVNGICQGTMISFTRKLRDASVQRYSGIISKSSGATTVEGSFSDESDKKYLWSGRAENPIPR